MNLSNNEAQFFSTLKFNNIDDIKSALNEINQKLNDVTRQVSFWDVYNITQVLLSDNDLASKLALLNSGEAAIVNANILNDGKDNHYRGDIAYRQMDGTLIWIPAENKGIYKPTFQYENGNIKVSYSYESAVPEEEGSPIYSNYLTMQTNQHGYLTEGPFLTLSSGNNYIDIDKQTVTFYIDEQTVASDFLRPVVRFYLIINGIYEDLYADWYWEEVIVDSNPKIRIHLDLTTSEITALSGVGTIYIRVR